MVRLVLHVEFQDNLDYLLEMPAPKLPDGVTWHEGMYLESNDPCLDYTVSQVWVGLDGNVEVHFFIYRTTVLFSDEQLQPFANDGWMRLMQISE